MDCKDSLIFIWERCRFDSFPCQKAATELNRPPLLFFVLYFLSVKIALETKPIQMQ